MEQLRHSEAGAPGLVLIDLTSKDTRVAVCQHVRSDCGLLEAQRKAQREREAEATKAATVAQERWLAEAGIGERYWGATRGLLREPAEICAYLDDLSANVSAGRGLVLLGPVGVGKSAALALVAREAYAAKVRTWATTVTRLMSHLLRGTEMRRHQSRMGETVEEDPKVRPLLLLDEFGAAYESDYAMAAFEDYMGWRYDNKRATCVAANRTPDELRANTHYARMIDRWRETCQVVVIGGESMRSEISARERAARGGSG